MCKTVIEASEKSNDGSENNDTKIPSTSKTTVVDMFIDMAFLRPKVGRLILPHFMITYKKFSLVLAVLFYFTDVALPLLIIIYRMSTN